MDERQIVIAGVYIGIFMYLLTVFVSFAWNLLTRVLAYVWSNPRSILIATMHLATVLGLYMLLGYTPFTFERLKVLVCIGMSCRFINVVCVIGSDLSRDLSMLSRHPSMMTSFILGNDEPLHMRGSRYNVTPSRPLPQYQGSTFFFVYQPDNTLALAHMDI